MVWNQKKWDEERPTPCKLVEGAKVEAVLTELESIRLTLNNGKTLNLDLYGDCCSHSYYTDQALQEAKSLVGMTLVSLDERSGSSPNNKDESTGTQENTSWHFLIIKTDKDEITLDWRNDSNGYYDGNVETYLTDTLN